MGKKELKDLYEEGKGIKADMIISSNVLFHFVDPLGAIFQIYDRLKIGGLMQIDIDNANSG